MKKIMVLLLLTTFLATACGQQEATKEESKDVNPVETVTDEEKAEEAKQMITVYYSNASADGLDKKEVTLVELTPVAVMEKLVEEGVVPSNVQVNDLMEKEEQGEQLLDLDLSDSFYDYMNQQGSAGESVTFWSICNTYLDAYGAHKIKVTVGGETLETGHQTMEGYYGFHE